MARLKRVCSIATLYTAGMGVNHKTAASVQMGIRFYKRLPVCSVLCCPGVFMIMHLPRARGFLNHESRRDAGPRLGHPSCKASGRAGEDYSKAHPTPLHLLCAQDNTLWHEPRPPILAAASRSPPRKGVQYERPNVADKVNHGQRMPAIVYQTIHAEATKPAPPHNIY